MTLGNLGVLLDFILEELSKKQKSQDSNLSTIENSWPPLEVELYYYVREGYEDY